MADKTFGFKVTDEVYDKAKLLIETSGLSSKEWFGATRFTINA